MRMTWLVALVAALVACDPPPTSIPPGEAQTMAPPPAEPPPPPSRPIEMPADGGAAPDVAVEPDGPAAPARPGGGGATVAAPARGAVGAPCDSAADCDTGVCEGEGCGPKGGRCAAKNRACTRDRRPYCGCDGNTFYSSGSCPGARFSARSACTGGGGAGAARLAADGAACKAAADCQSGVCEGEGCGPGSSGVCMSRKRPCTADLRPYCGCDGVTFRSSSSCPGRRFASRGECKK